jgi:hypothetical protein
VKRNKLYLDQQAKRNKRQLALQAKRNKPKLALQAQRNKPHPVPVSWTTPRLIVSRVAKCSRGLGTVSRVAYSATLETFPILSPWLPKASQGLLRPTVSRVADSATLEIQRRSEHRFQGG